MEFGLKISVSSVMVTRVRGRRIEGQTLENSPTVGGAAADNRRNHRLPLVTGSTVDACS